jgi:hypothetical protein
VPEQGLSKYKYVKLLELINSLLIASDLAARLRILEVPILNVYCVGIIFNPYK